MMDFGRVFVTDGALAALQGGNTVDMALREALEMAKEHGGTWTIPEGHDIVVRVTVEKFDPENPFGPT